MIRYRTKPKKQHREVETGEQIAFAHYMNYAYPNVLWTASAGGMRTTWGVAKKMKAMGYSAGTPDIMIFESRNHYHALFIELKRPKVKGESRGSISKEQSEWLSRLKSRGYKALVCYGSEEAMKTVDTYLQGVEE